MERFRFLQGDIDVKAQIMNWYLVPEDMVDIFNDDIHDYWYSEDSDEEAEARLKLAEGGIYNKYKLGRSIEAYSFTEPRWEEG